MERPWKSAEHGRGECCSTLKITDEAARENYWGKFVTRKILLAVKSRGRILCN